MVVDKWWFSTFSILFYLYAVPFYCKKNFFLLHLFTYLFTYSLIYLYQHRLIAFSFILGVAITTAYQHLNKLRVS